MPRKERMAGHGQVSNLGPDNPKERETFNSSSISELVNWIDFSDPDYITTATVSPGNPLAYYNMEEGGSGTTLTDRSPAGNSLNGVISNGTWNSTYKKSGTYSLEFNGSSTSVEIDELCDDMVSTAWSVFAWVRTEGAGETAFKVIFAINDSGGGNRFLFVMKDGKAKIYDTDYRGYNWHVSINDEEWHHVGVVYDGPAGGYGDIYRIYVDGVMDSTYEGGQVVVDATDKFTLGAEYDGGSLSDFWDGYMDDVVVYDSAITSEQVKELYNGGATPPDLTSADEQLTADTVVLQATCKVTDRNWGPLRSVKVIAPSWQLINGKKAAKFMRGEYLTGTLVAYGSSVSQPNTVLMAIELANTGSTYDMVWEFVCDGDDVTYRNIIARTPFDLGLWAGTAVDYLAKGEYTTGSLDVLSALFYQYSSKINTYITGSNGIAANQTIGTKAAEGFYIGERFSIDTTNGAMRFSGSIGEILIFEKALNPDEYLLATSYLANKWKIFKDDNIASVLEPDGTAFSTTFDILA